MVEVSPKLQHRIYVLKAIYRDCVMDVDGSWVYWPVVAHGAYPAADLRVISELLTEANRRWDIQVAKGLREFA